MNTAWPSQDEIRTGTMWVERYPRPTKENTNPLVLESRQAEWDEANARLDRIKKGNAEARAKREADEQKKRDAASAEAEAKRQKSNVETEAMLRRRFLSAGGSEAEWDAEKAEIISEHRRRAVAAGDAAEEQKRAAQAVLYRSW